MAWLLSTVQWLAEVVTFGGECILGVDMMSCLGVFSAGKPLRGSSDAWNVYLTKGTCAETVQARCLCASSVLMDLVFKVLATLSKDSFSAPQGQVAFYRSPFTLERACFMASFPVCLVLVPANSTRERTWILENECLLKILRLTDLIPDALSCGWVLLLWSALSCGVFAIICGVFYLLATFPAQREHTFCAQSTQTFVFKLSKSVFN